MDFELTDAQRDIRRSARKLAESEFSEDAFQWQGEYPVENMEVLGEHGFLGMTLPEEYGGADLDWLDNQMIVEGIGSVCPETAETVVDSNGGNAQIIAEFGEDSVKEEYLPDVCSGESELAIAMSEMDAGSAVTEMTTEAEVDGDEYVVNGSKAWVSGATRADAFVTYLRMPDGYIGSMLVDAETPGLTIADPDQNMYDEEQSQLFFDNARVPEDHVLVSGKDAFSRQIKTYNVTRVMSMGFNWTMARWLLEEAIEYAQHREQFGKPIGDFQAVKHRLADMAIKLETSRHLIYNALSGNELPGRLRSSMTKVYVSEVTHEVADAALQIKAAAGFVGETPESFAYRRLRGSTIYSGTSDIHRNMIADSLFERGFPQQ